MNQKFMPSFPKVQTRYTSLPKIKIHSEHRSLSVHNKAMHYKKPLSNKDIILNKHPSLKKIK